MPAIRPETVSVDAVLQPVIQSPGRLEWIGLRPQRRAPVTEVVEARAIEGRGLVGDHYVPKRGGRREVTLIQAEDLADIAVACGLSVVDGAMLRRNLAVSGLCLTKSETRLIQIGEVVLRPTGPCSPCVRMDEALGSGGRRAMKGRGGITAEIVRGGIVRVGDVVSLIGK